MKLKNSVVEFAFDMEKKLRENEQKGGWGGCDYDMLFEYLEIEVRELKEKLFPEKFRESINFEVDVSQYDLVKFGEKLRIDAAIKECADIGNFAMMIADNLKKELKELKK